MSRESFFVDMDNSTDISDIIDRMIEFHVEEKEKEMQDTIDELEERIEELESEILELRSMDDD